MPSSMFCFYLYAFITLRLNKESMYACISALDILKNRPFKFQNSKHQFGSE